MSAAWFCPACQKHHAPHVETCPGIGLGGFPGQMPFHPLTSPIFEAAKPKCKVCGIIFDGPMGYVCPNTNCPSGFATCATTTTLRAVQ